MPTMNEIKVRCPARTPIFAAEESSGVRKRARSCCDHSIGGSATGHFVVVHGYDPVSDSVLVADPLHDNPRFGSSSYRVGIMRLLGSIMLGVLTYDANLLVVQPLGREGPDLP